MDKHTVGAVCRWSPYTLSRYFSDRVHLYRILRTYTAVSGDIQALTTGGWGLWGYGTEHWTIDILATLPTDHSWKILDEKIRVWMGDQEPAWRYE